MEEIARSIQVAHDVVVVVSNTVGDTDISSWEKNEVRIIAKKTASARTSEEAREYAGDMKLKVVKRNTGRVKIDVDYPDWGGERGVLDALFGKRPTGRVDFEIRVPLKAVVVITATGGDVSAEDLGSAVAIAVTSGDVEVRGIKGSLAVTATSGDIDVDEVDGDTEISATSGDVTVVAVSGALAVGVTTGDVYCKDVDGPMAVGGTSSTVIISDCDGDVEVSTSSGDVEVIRHRGGVTVNTVNGFVELEIEMLRSSDCEVETSGGDVEIEMDSDGSYYFLIGTVSGEIELSMPEDMEVNASAHSLEAKYRGGKREVRVTTISGDILISD